MSNTDFMPIMVEQAVEKELKKVGIEKDVFPEEFYTKMVAIGRYEVYLKPHKEEEDHEEDTHKAIMWLLLGASGSAVTQQVMNRPCISHDDVEMRIRRVFNTLDVSDFRRAVPTLKNKPKALRALVLVKHKIKQEGVGNTGTKSDTIGYFMDIMAHSEQITASLTKKYGIEK